MTGEQIKVETSGTPPMGSGDAINPPPESANASGSISQSNPPQPEANGAVGASGSPNLPPPKTDKPRPHVCGTCGRSFARLEHLKRHERSHTKEKPFECPECTRCFARRDLLLRHQQKLHMTATASSRPKSGRRDSTSGAPGNGAGRVRKNSIANSVAGGSTGGPSNTARPRANTISHTGGASFGMIASEPGERRNNGLSHRRSHHPSLNGLPGIEGYSFRGMSTTIGHHGNAQTLPKLNTSLFGADYGRSLRTAPPFGTLSDGFHTDHLFGPGSTINPAQLHFGDAFGTPSSPTFQPFPPFNIGFPTADDEEAFDWVRGFSNPIAYNNVSDPAIDGSSPSAMSTTSQSGVSEPMMDGSSQPLPVQAFSWQHAMMQQNFMSSTPFALDTSESVFTDVTPPFDNLAAEVFHNQNGLALHAFPASSPLGSVEQGYAISDMSNHIFHPPMTHGSDRTSVSSASMNSSARHSSVTSNSTDSITDNIRQSLLINLAHSGSTCHPKRRFSQPLTNSPLLPIRKSPAPSVSLPSTADLQRFVSAYICYFHPHLPFLHIPTLSFESAAFTNTIRDQNGYINAGHGVGCLILAMAAIGALYEFEQNAAKDLFESAQKMIRLYLEERRKADKESNNESSSDSPLWLVQAMLLNLIYGYQCGEKSVADAAFSLCATVVSLARAAGLTKPASASLNQARQQNHGYGEYQKGDVSMRDGYMSPGAWPVNGQYEGFDLHAEWLHWKTAEESKRTLFSIFILSSMLVSAFNHAPSLTNSEIHIDLPCEEDLWAADSAQMWYAMGGASIAQEKSIYFADALSTLLTAGQREPLDSRVDSWLHQPFGSGMPRDKLPQSDLKPSTFGCLVLINALHNYIWETRQRHQGKHWTMQETESMHAHIEPALRAWQAAWASNPQHRLERPNPFGVGPLSADSIPLLDLAYVRLFVNLGRSKEAFWQRDFHAMAEEIARGAEIVQHAESSDSSPDSSGSADSIATSCGAPLTEETSGDQTPSDQQNENIAAADQSPMQKPSSSVKRERHLRKAAFYAADSLSMADKLGVTFADLSSRELPIQSAMCAFDCAQVLAEWVATVQDRVGNYLGILGLDNVPFDRASGLMLLEDEDYKLLAKIADILRNAEAKMAYNIQGMGTVDGMGPVGSMLDTKKGGYGAKILLTMATMLEKAMIWPVTRLMARSLQTQAAHMNRRAEASLTQ